MKLTEMREWLGKRDIQLTKSLGQNFLHDAHQLQRIVEAAELTKADKVLEIGPGLGPLTELLMERAGQVLNEVKEVRRGVLNGPAAHLEALVIDVAIGRAERGKMLAGGYGDLVQVSDDAFVEELPDVLRGRVMP